MKILIPDMADHKIPYLVAFSYYDEATLNDAEIHRSSLHFRGGEYVY